MNEFTLENKILRYKPRPGDILNDNLYKYTSSLLYRRKSFVHKCLNTNEKSDTHQKKNVVN